MCCTLKYRGRAAEQDALHLKRVLCELNATRLRDRSSSAVCKLGVIHNAYQSKSEYKFFYPYVESHTYTIISTDQ